MLWKFAEVNAKDGDLSRFDPDDLAAWLEWDFSAFPALLDALVDCGFLDRDGDRLAIHDWREHAPTYIRGMIASMEAPLAKPTPKGGAKPGAKPPPKPPSKPGAKPPSKPGSAEGAIHSLPFLTIPSHPIPSQEGAEAPAPEAPLVEKPAKEPKWNAFRAEMPFGSEEFRSAWLDWCKHLAGVNRLQSRQAVEGVAKQFALWGEAESIEAIRYSLSKGYYGIYQPKTGPKRGEVVKQASQAMREGKAPSAAVAALFGGAAS